jgi:hypothetical protein
MKAILYFLLFFSFTGFSQSLVFKTGLNFTDYDYKNSKNITNSNIDSSTGSFYEIGYIFEIRTGNFRKRAGCNLCVSELNYTSSISLNQYNAKGGNNIDQYSWDTNYIGWNNYINYSFLSQKQFLDISIKGGLGIATIINGKQQMGGQIFDLKYNNEFNGLWIYPTIGLNIRYDLFNQTYLSLGYDFTKLFSLNKNSESLSFNNKQLGFGILININ